MDRIRDTDMRAAIHAHLQHTSEVTGSGIDVSVIVANARSGFLGHSEYYHNQSGIELTPFGFKALDKDHKCYYTDLTFVQPLGMPCHALFQLHMLELIGK